MIEPHMRYDEQVVVHLYIILIPRIALLEGKINEYKNSITRLKSFPTKIHVSYFGSVGFEKDSGRPF